MNEIYINDDMPPAPKRRVILWLGIAVGALVLTLIIVGVCFWLFRPGFREPIDIGVEATLDDYQSALNKLGMTVSGVPQKGEARDWRMEYGPAHEVNCELTSEELTALFAFNRPVFEPVENLQIKFGEDGQMEISGTVERDWVISDVLQGIYSQDDLEMGIGVGVLPEKINFYAEIIGSILNDKPELHIEKTNIHGFNLSKYLVGEDPEAVGMIDEALEAYWDAIVKSTGLSLSLCELKKTSPIDTVLLVQGQVPSSMQWVEK
ncbi:MAG: hypothetical protein FWD16_05635 [Clostridia bacterium]|nr:hypothetical protein [Clostridia bacterium]